MKRYEFEGAVYESDLDAGSKAILAYYAHKKNWNEDGKVWTSAASVAKALNLGARTVQRRIPILRELGWLIDTGQRKGNGAIVYDLAIGTTVTETVVQILEGDNHRQSGGGTYATETRTYATQTQTTVRVADEQVKNKKEQVREQVSKSPDADAPVDDEPSNSKVKERSKNYLLLLNKGQREVLERMANTYGASPQQRQDAAALLKENKFDASTFLDKVQEALTTVGVEVRTDEW